MFLTTLLSALPLLTPALPAQNPTQTPNPACCEKQDPVRTAKNATKPGKKARQNGQTRQTTTRTRNQKAATPWRLTTVTPETEGNFAQQVVTGTTVVQNWGERATAQNSASPALFRASKNATPTKVVQNWNQKPTAQNSASTALFRFSKRNNSTQVVQNWGERPTAKNSASKSLLKASRNASKSTPDTARTIKRSTTTGTTKTETQTPTTKAERKYQRTRARAQRAVNGNGNANG